MPDRAGGGRCGRRRLLAIAAAAVGMAGKEGELFRKVFGWSILLLLFMCVIVVLQSSAVLSWMVPG